MCDVKENSGLRSFFSISLTILIRCVGLTFTRVLKRSGFVIFFACIFVYLYIGLSNISFAAPDSNNSKATATELNVEQTGNFSINANDDPYD